LSDLNKPDAKGEKKILLIVRLIYNSSAFTRPLSKNHNKKNKKSPHVPPDKLLAYRYMVFEGDLGGNIQQRYQSAFHSQTVKILHRNKQA